MSYSFDVKTELSEIGTKKRELRRAELAGIAYFSATLSLGRQGLSFSLSTEHMDVVRRAISLIEKLYTVEFELSAIEQPPKMTMTYIIKISSDTDTRIVMDDLGLEISAGVAPREDIFETVLKTENERKCFARGAFLGGGSISDPQKSYQMEFVTAQQSLAEPLMQILKKWKINVKGTTRKNAYVVYLKESESIIELLTRIGAVSSLLEIENIKIMKSINNDVNRASNFELANMDRIVASSDEHIRCIMLIQQHMGLDTLPKNLRDMAELRLAHPDESLAELAELSGTMTKSGINHRLRKIREIASAIPQEQ